MHGIPELNDIVSVSVVWVIIFDPASLTDSIMPGLLLTCIFTHMGDYLLFSYLRYKTALTSWQKLKGDN